MLFRELLKKEFLTEESLRRQLKITYNINLNLIKKTSEENKEEPAFYECGNCKRLFYDKEKAEQCCKPIICSNCGREKDY